MEKNRKLLRPIFNVARKHPEYKGKCRMEDDTLVIHGKIYTVDNLCSLPEDISGYNVSSRSNETTLAFFGELNPFSNFHPCKFEYSGMQFHSSEQLVQYMKAVLFDDTLTATSILDCETALGCKQLGKDMKGYNRDTWINCAREMCEGGL